MPAKASAGRITTEDIDQQNQVASIWKVTHRQISAGKFKGSTDYGQVNGLLLYRQQWTKSALVTGTSPAGYLALGGSDWRQTRLLWCGRELDAEHLAYGFDAIDTEFVIPDGSDHRVLLVPRDSLLRILGEEAFAALQERRHLLRCEVRLSQQLFAMIDRVVAKLPSLCTGQSNDLLLNAIESQLLSTVAEMLFAANADAEPWTPRKRYLACRRAIRYADGRNDRMTVPEFAAGTGVSQRVLELGFQETLGISPRRFLQWSRLNLLHGDLTTARSGDSTVTEHAVARGFAELGRTAVQYRELFGESPSETLARTHRGGPKTLADALVG